MRSIDWSQSTYGPVASWPQSLRTAVSMMLESRFAMVVAWGPDFRFFYNDRYIPVLGVKHPQALGTPAKVIFPEVWHLIGPEFERTRRGETFALDDWYLPIQRSGYLENCWFTVSYSPIRDETGGVGGMLAVVAETTGRVESERRLKTLRELAAGARTPEQAGADAARAFERNPIDVPFAIVFGLDAAHAAHRLAVAGLPATHRAAVASAWPLASALAAPIVLDDLAERFGDLPGGAADEPTRSAIVLPLVRPGAPPHGVLVIGLCPRRRLDDRYREFLELAAEHLATALGNARDLDDQRRRAEALAELDRAKTTFFSNVSHELRTPLALILGPLEDLLADPAVAPEVHAQHQLVHRNALRLHKLVNAMLDFSRIEAGRAVAAYEPTDLATLTTDLAGMFRSAVERAGLALVVDCPPLPAPVFVDREMWEKIVLNLLSNALKFTFEGTISVALRAVGEAIELVVRDTGAGIPAGELARVFERFHRVEGARSRTHEGTGIGLALALELARLHGGTIEVASELGKGTQFTVRIRTGHAHLPPEHVVSAPLAPLRANAYVEEAVRWLPDGAGPTDDAGPGPRILVADDNADMREYLRRALATHWQVTTTGDGAAALAEIRRARPDVLVTDVMMPGLDGFGLLAAVRRDPSTRALPVVIVSARAGEDARSEGLEAGASDYLVKPFHARELVARVGAQLVAVAGRRAADLRMQQLQALFMQAPTPICILTGPQMIVELANEQACTVWQRAPAEVRGRPLLEVLPQRAHEDLPAQIASVLATGQPFVARERMRLVNGRETYFNFVHAPMRDLGGEIIGVISVAFDVTEEIHARRELARSVEYSETFTAMLGHDLRNPLNAISTAAQLVQRRATSQDILRPVSRIVTSSERMSRMIEQLLDLARTRIGAGLRLQPRVLDLGELCQSVLDELRVAHPGSRVELIATGSLRGSWDGDRLAQVISNLAGNALEHGMPRTPVHVHLDGRDPGRVSIKVENAGEIAPEALPILFDPFRGVARRREATRGLGLGLYISREIVVAHRGRIDVRSTPEAGTCFEIELPKEAAEQVETP